MEPSSEAVARYLREHPEFFDEYAEILVDIQLPHLHGNGAIPISERQIIALRDRNRTLQNKLAELIRFGEENGALAEKMHRLAVALLTFTRLRSLVHGLKFNLGEHLSIPHVALRLWNVTGEDTTLPELSPTSTDIHGLAEDLAHPYCGPHILDEIRNWFGEDAARLRSFAMVALRAEHTLGLLVMGSEDPHRFYPEMGIIYLTRLGELVSAALRHFHMDENRIRDVPP